MFSYYNNLKYIDIKNLNSDKMFKNSFNNSKLFYICESMFIIRNSYAYNCCEYNFETNKCGYIPPAFPDSTIMYESTNLYSSLIEKSSEYTINTEFSKYTEQYESSEMNQITTQLEEKTESSTIITSDIVQTTPEEEKIHPGRIFPRKQTRGLKPGIIAAIVIIVIAVLVSMIFIVRYIRKKDIKSKSN